MNSLWLIIIAAIVFVIAYITYGKWLAKEWGIDDNRKTPAHNRYNGSDYNPAKPAALLGHHLSSIAGASPVIGPIQAAVFGWLPVFLWIIVGSIFVGGVQDFGAIFASLRHDGKSIGQIVEANMGRTGKRLFNFFAWLMLLLVIAAFIDICAKTFTTVPQAGTASLSFTLLAMVFGYFTNRKRTPLWLSTMVGMVFLLFSIWIGMQYPMVFSANPDENSRMWITIILIYIAIASVLPIWILLQPRDYLNSFLFYALMSGAFIGLFIKRPEINLDMFTSFTAGEGNYLFPMLFVTLTCGAVSGFHSLVGSGTSSKQINKESDARLIGYGAMLIEGLFAIVALITAGYFAAPQFSDLMKSGGPVSVFSKGVSEFMAAVGIPQKSGVIFVSLTITAFALTSLDTATRIGRYIFQETFDKADDTFLSNKYISTLITVAVAGALTLTGYSRIWSIFGTANQLLAALAFLAIGAYLIRQGRNAYMILVPMVLMFAVATTALIFEIHRNIVDKTFLLAIIALGLLALAVVLFKEGWKILSSIRILKRKH